MKARELIAQLEDYIDRFGNLPIQIETPYDMKFEVDDMDLTHPAGTNDNSITIFVDHR